MKAQNVRIADLETYTDCLEAIEEIENDYQNSIGGIEAWYSGRPTYLKESAKKKIAAINRKAEKLYSDEIC